jgi:hypothetical protein
MSGLVAEFWNPPGHRARRAARVVGSGGPQTSRSHPPAEEFTGQIRDLYLPPGDVGFWQGALRDPAAGAFQGCGCGDQGQGAANSQHAVWRFRRRPAGDQPVRVAVPKPRWLVSSARHFGSTGQTRGRRRMESNRAMMVRYHPGGDTAGISPAAVVSTSPETSCGCVSGCPAGLSSVGAASSALYGSADAGGSEGTGAVVADSAASGTSFIHSCDRSPARAAYTTTSLLSWLPLTTARTAVVKPR